MLVHVPPRTYERTLLPIPVAPLTQIDLHACMHACMRMVLITRSLPGAYVSGASKHLLFDHSAFAFFFRRSTDTVLVEFYEKVSRQRQAVSPAASCSFPCELDRRRTPALRPSARLPPFREQVVFSFHCVALHCHSVRCVTSCSC